MEFELNIFLNVRDTLEVEGGRHFKAIIFRPILISDGVYLKVAHLTIHEKIRPKVSIIFPTN